MNNLKRLEIKTKGVELDQSEAIVFRRKRN